MSVTCSRGLLTESEGKEHPHCPFFGGGGGVLCRFYHRETHSTMIDLTENRVPVSATGERTRPIVSEEAAQPHSRWRNGTIHDDDDGNVIHAALLAKSSAA